MLERPQAALAVAGLNQDFGPHVSITRAAKVCQEIVEGLCIECRKHLGKTWQIMAGLGKLCEDADCFLDMPNLLRTGEVCDISQRLFADGGRFLRSCCMSGLAPGRCNVFAFPSQAFSALALMQLLSVCSSVRGAPGAASRRGSVALGLGNQTSPNCSEGPASEVGRSPAAGLCTQ